MTVTTWIRAWCGIRPCMITVWAASVVGRIRQACHYRSLVREKVTERFVLMVKG